MVLRFMVPIHGAHPEIDGNAGKVVEPSRLCPEQRRDAAATIGTSHWEFLRSCSTTNNFGIRPYRKP